MNIPPKPMHLKDHKTPKAWRMNADTIHNPDGKWIKLNSCYKPLKLDCACRECVQGDYLDDKGNSVLIEGVAVGCHEESDIFLENCIGLYAKDEMIEVEFMTDDFESHRKFEINLDKDDEDIPF